MHQAKIGDRVQVQYFRIPKHGPTIDKRRGAKKCEFIVGSSDVFPSLSTGVVGMSPGDRKRLTLPAEAYGAVKPKLIRRIRRERIPKDLVLRVGMQLTSVNAASGRRRRVRIAEIQPHSVLVNENHRRAGKEIELEVVLMTLDSSSNAS